MTCPSASVLQSVATRFYRWNRQGVWQRILQALQREADRDDKFDWIRHYLEGSNVRAHQLPRAEMGERRALGRSRGGFSNKIHLRPEGNGSPMTFEVSAGQRPEASMFEPLMNEGAVNRGGRGATRDAWWEIRGTAAATSGGPYARHLRATIPRRQDERRRGVFDYAEYRLRNLVERLFKRLQQFRRVATRYGKLASNYEAMLNIAAIRVRLNV